MDKLIFPFFMEIFDEKRREAGGKIKYPWGTPYFTFFISYFSVKREPYRNFFFITYGCG